MPAKKVRKIDSLAVIATVSQAPETLIRFCQHHLAIGADHIFLFFDRPRENNIAVLQNEARITCINCTSEHWRSAGFRDKPDLDDMLLSNYRAGIRMCRDAGITYAALVDGDELVYSDRSLKDALAQAFVGLDAVVMLPYEAMHDRGTISGGPFEAKNFKSLPNRLNQYFAPLIYRRIWERADHGFLGHIIGKSIIRTGASNYRFETTHRPVFDDESRIAKTNQLKLLHYDCLTIDEWAQKWRKRFQEGVIVKMRSKRHGQLAEIEIAQKMSDRNLEKLYRTYHLYSDVEILFGRSLGLVKRFEARIHEGIL